MHERKIEWHNGMDNGKLITFEQGEAHLVETMFHEEWAPFGESSVSKPQDTFFLKWGDIQDDPKLDLKELLA